MRELLTGLIACLMASLPGAGRAAAQSTGCPQPLAKVSLAERSYDRVDVREFEGRVFVYVPAITSSGGRLERFDAWVIEGIYGRPFVQEAGPLDPAAFERLRASANVRATRVSVAQSPTTAPVTIRRQPFLLTVTVQRDSSGSETVAALLCRPR